MRGVCFKLLAAESILDYFRQILALLFASEGVDDQPAIVLGKYMMHCVCICGSYMNILYCIWPYILILMCVEPLPTRGGCCVYEWRRQISRAIGKSDILLILNNEGMLFIYYIYVHIACLLACYNNPHLMYMRMCNMCIPMYVGDYPHWLDTLAVTQGTHVITMKSNESIETQNRWLKMIGYSNGSSSTDDEYHTLLDGQNYEGEADPLKDVETLANSVLNRLTLLRSPEAAGRPLMPHREEARARSFAELLASSHYLVVADMLSFLRYHNTRLFSSNTDVGRLLPLSLLFSVDNSLTHQAEENQLLFDLRSMNTSTLFVLNNTGTALVDPSCQLSSVTQYHAAWLAGCYPDPVVEGFSFDEHATLVMTYLRPTIDKGPAHLNQRSYNITDPLQCVINHSSSPSYSAYATATVDDTNNNAEERETHAHERRLRLLCVTYSLSTRFEQVDFTCACITFPLHTLTDTY